MSGIESIPLVCISAIWNIWGLFGTGLVMMSVILAINF